MYQKQLEKPSAQNPDLEGSLENPNEISKFSYLEHSKIEGSKLLSLEDEMRVLGFPDSYMKYVLSQGLRNHALTTWELLRQKIVINGS